MTRHRHTILSRALLTAVLLSFGTVSAHTFFLHKKGNLCDGKNEVCLRGTLTYEDHNNTIEFYGRVNSRSGPGLYSIRMRGKTLGKQVAYTAFDVHISGRHGEIINKRMRPDAPLQTEWSISAVYFFPDKE